jgi:hypothetical protein
MLKSAGEHVYYTYCCKLKCGLKEKSAKVKYSKIHIGQPCDERKAETFFESEEDQVWVNILLLKECKIDYSGSRLLEKPNSLINKKQTA